ncbi:hypothetical protein HK107_01020 [Parvularcula sp. ZS-1/3]|uniref:Uncharacterized protein n=1 Tax=Parvularcula mediterranea TaxID=2732508 RepID=A0A7Y3W3X5_9PROT|nr:hypothetical protein [Parvularcula mediterranea]NNU14903.1 hypothetical protein [Parvularcula mediterranea]
MRILKLIASVIAVAFLSSAGGEASSDGEPIGVKSFKEKTILLYHKPTEKRPGSRVKDLDGVKVRSLGETDEMFLVSFFPENGLIGIMTAKAGVVIVERDEVISTDEEALDEKMGIEVPPGGCIDALSVARSRNNGTSGTTRGMGAC